MNEDRKNNGNKETEEEMEDEKQGMFFGNRTAWIIVLVSTLLIGIVSGIASGSVVSFSVGIVIGLTVFLALIIGSLVNGYRAIPHKYEWIVEQFGKYVGEPLEPGVWFKAPLFVKIKARVYMGEQIMELFLDEAVTTTYSGGGDVEFVDESAPVQSRVFFRIIDSAKAIYNIIDVFRGVEEKTDGALRSYLGKYTIDQATQLKIHFKKYHVFNGIKVDESGGGIVPPEKTATEQEILNNWGVEISEIVITDIVLPDRAKKERARLLAAEKDVQVAEKRKQERIIGGEAEKKTLDLEGQGIERKIKRITASGASPSEAVGLLQKFKLYENIGQNAVIVESGDSLPGSGAKFGAGFAKGSEAAQPKSEK